MGGGDLNLKKSWHPSTFQNLEKVWKAEQRHDQEKKKIEQLQQEIREERAREDMQRAAVDSGLIKKRDERVEWLYSGPAGGVNREEYLLGKKIDRLVDPMLKEEEREKEALSSGPGALFVGSDSANTSADLAVKVREDPLFMIRQREEAAKKRLASNPMKLRQLKKMAEEKRKDPIKRKHKKKKRRYYSSDEGSSSPSPRQRSRSPSPQRHLKLKTASSRRKQISYPPPRQRSRSPPPRQRSRSPPPRQRSPLPRQRSRSPPPRQRSPSSQKPSQRRHYSYKQRPYSKTTSHTRGMDSAELERRRREMMESAKEHGVEREQRLRRHEAEATLEEQAAKTQHKSDFLQPLRVKSLSSSGSLGDRIHRNIHSVQRTSAKLNSNFMDK